MFLSSNNKKKPHIHRTWVLLGDSNQPIMCWEGNIATHKQSRRFLEGIDVNFLKEVIKDPTKVHALLHLIFTKKKLVGDARVWSNIGCSDHGYSEVENPERREESKQQDLQPWASGEQA